MKAVPTIIKHAPTIIKTIKPIVKAAPAVIKMLTGGKSNAKKQTVKKSPAKVVQSQVINTVSSGEYHWCNIRRRPNSWKQGFIIYLSESQRPTISPKSQKPPKSSISQTYGKLQIFEVPEVFWILQISQGNDRGILKTPKYDSRFSNAKNKPVLIS